jgi:hypothetical protein
MLPDVSRKVEVDTDSEYMLISNRQNTGEQFHIKVERWNEFPTLRRLFLPPFSYADVMSDQHLTKADRRRMLH